MSIIYLSHNDFYIQNKQSNDQFSNTGVTEPVKLCNKLKGLSLVYFSSNQCSFCDTFQPIFEQLPRAIGGCYFAIINVSNNNQIVKASTNSTTPIKYVPYLLLYFSGIPFMRYDGVRNLESIKTFIFEVANRLQQNSVPTAGNSVRGSSMGRQLGAINETQNQMNQHMRKDDDSDGKNVPTYAAGKPKKTKDVCFLTLDEAYST